MSLFLIESVSWCPRLAHINTQPNPTPSINHSFTYILLLSMGRVQRHKRIKDLKAWVDRPEHLKIDHSKDAKLPRSFRNFLQIQKLATQPPKPKPKSQPATTPTTTDKTLKKKSSSSSSTSTTTTADTSDSPHLKPLVCRQRLIHRHRSITSWWCWMTTI